MPSKLSYGRVHYAGDSPKIDSASTALLNKYLSSQKKAYRGLLRKSAIRLTVNPKNPWKSPSTT